jgi:hypothetical protein
VLLKRLARPSSSCLAGALVGRGRTPRGGDSRGDVGPVEILRGALFATKASGQPDWPTRVSAARALAALRPEDVEPKTEHEQPSAPSIVVYDLPPGADPVLHRAPTGGAAAPLSDAEAPSEHSQRPILTGSTTSPATGRWFPSVRGLPPTWSGQRTRTPPRMSGYAGRTTARQPSSGGPSSPPAGFHRLAPRTCPKSRFSAPPFPLGQRECDDRHVRVVAQEVPRRRDDRSQSHSSCHRVKGVSPSGGTATRSFFGADPTRATGSTTGHHQDDPCDRAHRRGSSCSRPPSASAG